MGSGGVLAAPAKRSTAMTLVLALLGSMLVVASTVLGGSPAKAAAGDPFDAVEPTVFIAQDNPTQLRRVETTGDGSYDFQLEGPAAEVSYNAVGYNAADGYIYGMVIGGGGSQDIPAGSLVRVGQEGTVERVGTQVYEHPNVRTYGWFVGEFNPSDGLYYVADSVQNTDMLAIDVATGTVVNEITLNVPLDAQDFAFKDGYAWAMREDGAVLRIDVATGDVTAFPGVLGEPGPYGAAWVFGNGNLGFSNNESGTVYQLSMSGSAEDPQFEVFSTVSGPSSSLNDGTSIPGLPADLQIVKSGPATYTSGESIVFDFTVTNNGEGVSSGWQVTETIPQGLSNPRLLGDAVSVDPDSDETSWKLNGGRLEPGESQTFQIEFDTTTTSGECVANVADVLGNEEDPDLSNNEDTAVSCDLELDIEKSSNWTPEARPGDVIDYTVTATNTGDGDYTVENPAVVFDDLSGVLDDATFDGEAQASQGDAPVYEEPLLSWSGPLESGDFVELTYSVTLAAGGDGEVRNVAWEPNVPEGPTPECDPADENGLDPVTGEPCAVVEYPLPRLSVEKVADQTDLPAVGGEVEYTITVTNEGPGAYTSDAPATMSDDLSDVLDDGELVGAPVASTGSASVDGETLLWEGALNADDTATITYRVEYTGEGDNNLRNLACVPEDDVLPGAEPCDVVNVPAAQLNTWKQVSASDDPAEAGSVLTYTLFFESTGQAPADVDYTDELTHVLDDADVTAEPTSADGLNAPRDGARISVTGSVPQGETYTVEYQVTVKPDGERGDDIAANFLVPGIPNDPPPEPVCEPTDVERPDCTVTPIAAVEYAKSVSASSDPVEAGTVLTYTVTVDSTGEATTPVSREDVLTGVLDDAELTSAPVSDTDSVTVSDVVDSRFEIGGELAGGETATITYEVTVLPDAERGDNSANNFLVPPGGDPRDECVEGSDECTSTPIPLITADKSVDPETGTTVLAGQDVTYTLTFANVGEASGSVDYTDDLSGVLDDANLVSGPVVSDPALTADLDAESILIGGTLAADQTVTVEYTVTVGPDGERGDNVLGNVLASSDVEDPNCEDENVSCTQNPVPEPDTWKQVESDSAPVEAGSVLTYTLFFENTGAADAVVDHTDLLDHVTDDAAVTVEPVADEGLEAVRDGNAITITGAVAPGETLMVEYQVTVKPDGERGDDIAANFLVPGIPNDPPPEPVCQPENGERPDCTVTPIGQLITHKAVEASTDPVEVGTELSYTLTFDNQGEGAATVDHVDDLSGVLDDAELTASPVASDEALSVSEVADGSFAITGELAAGQTVTVSYTVTVLPDAERGDDWADNFLVPEGEEPPEECIVGEDPNCTSTPISGLLVEKHSDPASGTEVSGGDEVTYTLSFESIGQAPAEVSYVDDLSGVLDDALLVSEVTADGELEVSGPDADQLMISGAVQPGETATVTYTVEVLPYASQGDHLLENFLIREGEEPPAECVDGSSLCTEHPISAPPVPSEPDEPDLAATGGTVAGGAIAAAVLALLLGGGLLFLRRGRQEDGQLQE
ncbi:DUF11 domain-containing protein [Microbacterium suaedae]|uniref:DUF11 domain-containing protein n=1 Tax=Microbacterium suaedae TaxID=2067813 RepID=UPI0013A5F993|nr:DUF11 domain-containing protein [Microbacterium suaedae]